MARIKASDVKFTGGPDPLGIGVPDLGRSSYDPLEQIRTGFERSRQERMIRQKERREDYQKFMEDLPTYEAINQNVAGRLNEKVKAMGDLALQKYKSGDFSPFAKTPTGEKTVAELGRLERETIEEGQAYEALLPVYKKARDFAANPANQEKIDWEETQKRMGAFVGAEDVKGMADAASQNLVVLKPEPVELNKWITERAAELIPEDDIQTSVVKDEETGQVITTKRKFKNPTKAANTYKDIYRNADQSEQRFVNAVNKDFERAVKRNDPLAVDEFGNPRPVEDFFAAKYVPEYANQITKTTKAIPKGGKLKIDLGIQKDEDGNLVMPEMTTSTYKMKIGGGDAQDYDFPIIYEAPISHIFKKGIPWSVSNKTINTETGEPPAKVGSSSENKPMHIQFQPIANKSISWSYTNEQGEEVPVTVKKGEYIPNQLYTALKAAGQQGDYTIRPMVASQTLFKKTQEGGGGLSFSKDGQIPKDSFYQQTLTPWEDVKDILLQWAKSEDVDLTEDFKKLNQIAKDLNEDPGVQYGFDVNPDMTDEEIIGGM